MSCEDALQVNTQLLDTLCAIADAAGQAVMDVYRDGCTVVDKADASPLTEADLRADSIIRKGLNQAYPGVFILSEESTSDADARSDYFFLVDPLDGTKEFINRNGEFTVNIALVHVGVAVAGVVNVPALGLCYYAGIGLGAWMRAGDEVRALCVAPRVPEATLRVIGSRSHTVAAMDTWLQQLSCDHTFVAAGSSLKFCRVAEGSADVYPRFAPTSQWDTAAAQCVLEAAGGAVINLAGKPLLYGMKRPILNEHFIAHGSGTVRSMLPIES